MSPWTARKREQVVGTVKAKFDRMTSAVFLDFKGMTVDDGHEAPRRVPEERRRVQGRQEHARSARASRTTRGRRSSPTSLVGMTGIAWSYEDPSAAAKVVKAFRKDNARSSRSRRGSSTAQVADRRRRSRPTSPRCRARTSCARRSSRRSRRRCQQFVSSSNAPGPELRVRADARRRSKDRGRRVSRAERALALAPSPAQSAGRLAPRSVGAPAKFAPTSLPRLKGRCAPTISVYTRAPEAPGRAALQGVSSWLNHA